MTIKIQIFRGVLFSLFIPLAFLITILIIAIIWHFNTCTDMPEWARAECLSYPASSLTVLFICLGACILTIVGDIYLIRRLGSNKK